MYGFFYFLLSLFIRFLNFNMNSFYVFDHDTHEQNCETNSWIQENGDFRVRFSNLTGKVRLDTQFTLSLYTQPLLRKSNIKLNKK